MDPDVPGEGLGMARFKRGVHKLIGLGLVGQKKGQLLPYLKFKNPVRDAEAARC